MLILYQQRFSDVQWSEVEGGEDEDVVVGRGFYILRRALVIHRHADVIYDAFIHVEEGNRGRIESS